MPSGSSTIRSHAGLSPTSPEEFRVQVEPHQVDEFSVDDDYLLVSWTCVL